jgi:hypothetical protein
VRLQCPPEKGVSREELISVRLAVAGPRPQLFAVSDATHGAFEESSEDHGERRVEPDHRIRARPHEIARAASAVVAIDDPALTLDRSGDALLEYVDRYECPVRTPCERVELDERHPEPTRELPRERGLARARRSDDGDPYETCFTVSTTYSFVPFRGFSFPIALLRSSASSGSTGPGGSLEARGSATVTSRSTLNR